MRTTLRLSTLLLCLALLASPLAALPVRADCGLNNNGFEEGFTDIYGDGHVVVANGWTFWFQDGPGQDQGKNYRPSYGKSEVWYLEGRRVRSGSFAQKLGTLYATHNGGVYQRVSVTPGSLVTFSVWGQAWSSRGENTKTVEDPGEYKLSVGIDPTGGTDWSAGSVRWSEPRTEYNTWLEFSISAQAEADAVTVFVRGQCEYPVTHNESVWDDACVTVVRPTPPPTNTPRPTDPPTVTPTPSATPSPAASPTPVTADVCFQSFEDANSNGARDDGEATVPGAAIALLDDAGATVAEGRTTGEDAPLCLNVPVGDYRLVVTQPEGYEAAGSAGEVLNVSGEPVQVGLGFRSLATSTPPPPTATPAPTVTPTPLPSPNLMTTLGQGFYNISGILVVLLAVLVIVLATRYRRSNQ